MSRILLAVLVFSILAGCTGTSQPKMMTNGAERNPPAVVIPSPTQTKPPVILPTATAKATQTLLPTATVLPTATIAKSATPAATLDTLRKTPPTLMLHMSNPDFDAVKFLEGLVQILKEKEIKVVTYQQITDQPEITALEQGRLFIITIDDVSLQAKIDPSIKQMIAILREAGYPAVLGIVTEGKLADEETASILKQLAGEGWELAIHTESHTNLHQLEQVSPYGARLEIRTCGDKIFQATGMRPITLVLPYGDMVEDLKILYRENIQWAVGIVRGEKYRTTNQVYYVGREGPAGDPERTFRVMIDRFNGQ